MAIAIRLTRGGAKKRPYYRVVVADSRAPRDGRFIEKVGTYNPLLAKDSPDRVKLDAERIGHWLSVGAQPSDRVARFLDAAGIRERAQRSNPNKGQPGDKAKERAEERATKEAEAAEAAAAATAAPAVEEAPEPEVTADADTGSEASAVEDVAAAEEVAPAAEAPAEPEAAQPASTTEPAEGADEVSPPTPDSPEPAEAPADVQGVSSEQPVEGAADAPAGDGEKAD